MRVGEGYIMSKHVYADKGLKSYFANIYQYLGINLALAGAVAFFVSSNSALFNFVIGTPFWYVVMFAPLGIAWYMSANMHSLSTGTMQVLYWVYGATIGASLSSIFVIYTTESIFKCFFIASAIFMIASIYGKTTSKDLSSMHSTLMVGLFGIVAVSIVNYFMHSAMIQYILSWAIVAVFTGYIAFDMQQLLAIYFTRQSDEMVQKISILGALHLFIAVVNIFIALLQLFGDRKRR